MSVPPPAAATAGEADVAANKSKAKQASGDKLAQQGNKAGTAPNSGTPANPAAHGGKAEDHLQLDTTQITGNQELPKVLYIVPWKRSDLGDLLGKPANSLLDEVLEPVDRDVFKRENRYYDALKPDAAGPAGGAVQGSGEKR